LTYLHDPLEIERRSFEIISERLGDRGFSPYEDRIIKRVIHTTADFDYADIIKISSGAIEAGLAAIKAKLNIVTDTKMTQAGINKNVLKEFGGEVNCYISDDDIVQKAAGQHITRAMAAMDYATTLANNKIFTIGNAPTALFRLKEIIEQTGFRPELIIGVPVGFVNVAESKQAIMKLDIPYIVSEGGKGGSTVAAAIINALLYILRDSRKET